MSHTHTTASADRPPTRGTCHKHPLATHTTHLQVCTHSQIMRYSRFAYPTQVGTLHFCFTNIRSRHTISMAMVPPHTCSHFSSFLFFCLPHEALFATRPPMAHVLDHSSSPVALVYNHLFFHVYLFSLSSVCPIL